MRILVAEDDFASGRILRKLLSTYGEVDVADDGEACIENFRTSMEEGDPYRLIFLDIVMPGLSGHETLSKIRAVETEWAVNARDEAKVVMTTVLEDPHNVMKAYNEGGATGYLVKPLSKEKVAAEMRRLGLA